MSNNPIVKTERIAVKQVNSATNLEIAKTLSSVQHRIFREKKYLDGQGLEYLVQQLCDTFATKDSVSGGGGGVESLTTDDINKLLF